jgi:DNA-binding protein H-NS
MKTETSLDQLKAQRDALDQRIREMQASAQADAIAQVRDLMARHMLTLADLGQGHSKTPKAVGAKVGPRTGATVAPKYREPSTGATWSGRGLKPRWLAMAIGSGKSIDEFRI